MPTLMPQLLPMSIRLLSILPSQSSSLPLHVSGTHCWPWHTGGSSMIPLQSSSMPLHTSFTGMPATSGTHAPFGMLSFTQHVVCVLLLGSHFLMPVLAQAPTPVVQLAP